MPHKFYHGKTGVVWNVTPRAVGVEVNKKVGNRVIAKRIHVRIEHVSKSRCRNDFLKRVKDNEVIKQQAKKEGRKDLKMNKRNAGLPKPGALVKAAKTELFTVTPLKYEFLV